MESVKNKCIQKYQLDDTPQWPTRRRLVSRGVEGADGGGAFGERTGKKWEMLVGDDSPSDVPPASPSEYCPEGGEGESERTLTAHVLKPMDRTR